MHAHGIFSVRVVARREAVLFEGQGFVESLCVGVGYAYFQRRPDDASYQGSVNLPLQQLTSKAAASHQRGDRVQHQMHAPAFETGDGKA